MGRTSFDGKHLRFYVRLTPRGGRDRIDGWAVDASGVGQLRVRVSVPPEKGKANESLLAVLARELHIAKSTIAITAGETARVKTIEIAGDAEALARRLEAIGGAK